MTIYYADLDKKLSGGTGTELNPWYADSFKNRCNGNLLSNDVINVKGSHEDLQLWNFYASNGGLIIKNWDLNQPWRISAGIINLDGNGNKFYNGILQCGGNYIEFKKTAEFYDCYILATKNFVFSAINNIIKGCSIIVDYNRTMSGVFSTSGSGSGVLTDSIIDSVLSTFNAINSSNCVFTAASVPGSGVHVNKQVGWVRPTLPVWNADRSLFNTSILSVGINTPPEPGNSPYTGYETGLWGETRIGIGAMYFGSDIVTCWSFSALYKNTKRFFKINGSGNCPEELQVPSNIDLSTCVMIEHGKFVDRSRYKLI